MIEVRSLSYAAGRFSLKDIDFDVKDSETLVVLGPTGAGKTVLLELIAGFRSPSQGSILIDGRDITGLPPEKRKVGFVYQDYLLFPHMSVFENIAYGLSAAGVKKGQIESKVTEIAARLGISHLLARRTKRLSGGEAQRVALARALVISPDVLLLDEPFAAVDPSTKEQLMRETGRMLDSWDIPVVHVTHDQVEASEMADRIAVMNEGRVVQVDTPGGIFNEPKTEFVANFVGTRNIFKGIARRVDGETLVDVGGLQLHSSVDIEGRVHVTIRPEDILVSPNQIASSARNSIPGVITELKDRGPVVYITADCGVDITAAITRESFNELKLTVGDKVFLTFKAPNVNLF